MDTPADEADPPLVRVLTVRQPWAWAIVAGIKDVENRTWATRHRGRFYIHAATRPASRAAWQLCGELAAVAGVAVPDRADLDFGALLGHVELRGIVTGAASPWAFASQRHWLLGDAEALPAAIPMLGRNLLWKMPAAALCLDLS